MQNRINTSIIPGDVSIDILEAVEKALAKFPRTPRPIVINREHLSRMGSNIRQNMRPGLERALTVLPYPVRQKIYYRRSPVFESVREKKRRVRRELLDAGVSIYGLLKAESRYLPKILHTDERVEAVIYGQHGSSSAMMVATDERIIYLDKKQMVELFDEVSYEVVSGIEFDIHLIFASVVLHTPVKNYNFRFVNLHCAEKFARLIETQKLEREEKEEEPEAEIQPSVPNEPEFNQSFPSELKDNMAGYYWLPTEEEERQKIQEGLIL